MVQPWERPLSHQGLVPCGPSVLPTGKITGRGGGAELEVSCSLPIRLSSRVATRLIRVSGYRRTTISALPQSQTKTRLYSPPPQAGFPV